MTINNIPVIAIDGPSASGKGTVARLVSEALGFYYLDSGVLYRLIALEAIQAKIDLNDEESLENIAIHLDTKFSKRGVTLRNKDVTGIVRHETYGNAASKVAQHSRLREALINRQRAFRKSPGLVADGRDMCSVVFPDATLKIFLTASVEIRAKRRYKQLMEKGEDVNITMILKDIKDRDTRDSVRSVAPLKQDRGSNLIDTTFMDVTEVVNKILDHYSEISVKSI
ncbi:MAG: cytidylate kinase [Nitrosomonadaceae bacterium]|nr:cytidylate kinase [Nitrosomonadaceae bacterium]|tara:strand:+ start:689 stop:1366 length:678 start_codon:yes stop_codon:yes gene_type:complete